MDDNNLRSLRRHLDVIESEVRNIKVKIENQSTEITFLLQHLMEVVEKKPGPMSVFMAAIILDAS